MSLWTPRATLGKPLLLPYGHMWNPCCEPLRKNSLGSLFPPGKQEDWSQLRKMQSTKSIIDSSEIPLHELGRRDQGCRLLLFQPILPLQTLHPRKVQRGDTTRASQGPTSRGSPSPSSAVRTGTTSASGKSGERLSLPLTTKLSNFGRSEEQCLRSCSPTSRTCDP